MTIVKKGSASFETKRPGFPDWTDIDNVIKHITEIISRCVFPSLIYLYLRKQLLNMCIFSFLHNNTPWCSLLSYIRGYFVIVLFLPGLQFQAVVSLSFASILFFSSWTSTVNRFSDLALKSPKTRMNTKKMAWHLFCHAIRKSACRGTPGRRFFSFSS